MRKWLLFLFILSWLNGAWAQDNKGTISFQSTFPQGEYKKTYPVTATGLLFGLVYRLQDESALSIGGQLGILEVNSKHKYYTGVYNNDYGSFLISSNNHIITMTPVVRADLLSRDKSWNMFIDACFGVNLFINASSISRDFGIDPITNDSRLEFIYSKFRTSFAFRTGAGMGVEMALGKKKKIMLLLKGSYLYGSHANYYAKPKIIDTNIVLQPRESKTSMILAEAGISFSFRKKKK